MQGPAKNWENVLLSLGVAGGEPGIEGEEIAPLAKEWPCLLKLISHGILFFSHNKSANNTFQSGFSVKRP